MTVGIALLSQEATERENIHAHHSSSRPLSEDYELVSLIGEAAFAGAFHLPLDLGRKPGGDGGADFVIPLAFRVDVKTARKPVHLIVEKGKVAADIYVLAQYIEDTKTARLLGWEWGAVLSKAPVKDFGYGIVNHYIHQSALRPISSLMSRVMSLSLKRSAA